MQDIQSKSQNIGYTWGRTTLVITNIILITIIIVIIILTAVNFKKIVNKIIEISLDSVKNNKQVQPTLNDFATTTAINTLHDKKVRAEIDDFATTTAINTLQDKKVRAEINDIIDTSLEPIQNDINQIANAVIPGTSIFKPNQKPNSISNISNDIQSI